MYEIPMKIRCWTRRTRPQNLLAAGEVDEVHTPGRRHARGRVPLPEHDHKHRVAPRGPIFRKCIFEKCIFRKFCKFLAGSFSAVSKRNFATKYAFDSIFQDLQDVHTFAPLRSQKFRKKIGLKIQQLNCLLYTSPSPRDRQKSRMPSSA